MWGKLTGVAVSVALLTGGVPATAAPPDELRNLVREQGFPGALLATGGRTRTAGVAELGKRQPPPKDGRVRVASVTKTFTAAVVLQLVAEGKVKLDDPAAKYVPQMRDVTVRQLLQQTSGLPDYAKGVDLNELRYRYVEPQELLDLALRHPSRFPPGTRWEYSNTNYVVAGLLIEKVTGRPVAEQIRHRIVDRTGLRDTYWPAQGERGLRGPHPHGYGRMTPTGQVEDVTELDPSWMWAAGQLVSTPADLQRFFKALMGGAIVPPAQLAEMKKTVPAELWPGASYGLGLISTTLSCGGEYWGHGGDVLGYSTRGGVTTDGRGAQLVVTSLPGTLETHQAVMSFVDSEFCGGRK